MARSVAKSLLPARLLVPALALGLALSLLWGVTLQARWASAAAASVAGSSASGRHLEPILVPLVTISPATAGALSGLPGLSDELSRAFIAVLREANLDARPAPPAGSSSTRAEAADMLSAHLEAVGGPRLRLTASWRGAPASAVGDLEHLDDLVYAVFEQLRPRLLAEAASYAPVPELAPASSGEPTVHPAAPAGTEKIPAPATASPPAHKGATGHSSAKASKPAPVPSTPSPPPSPTPAPAPSPAPAVTPPATSPAAPVEPPAASSPLSPLPPAPLAETAPPRQVARPRVSVHVVGDPSGPLPAAFYGPGFGVLAQQVLIHYLQTRLRVAPVASRLVGLVGGLEALTQSLRLGARYTMMVRFDTLSDVFGSYGARTLTGRLHVVLLVDSRPLLDRSLALTPTPYYPTETPAAVLGRALTAAMDGIAGELSSRLYSAPSP